VGPARLVPSALRELEVQERKAPSPASPRTSHRRSMSRALQSDRTRRTRDPRRGPGGWRPAAALERRSGHSVGACAGVTFPPSLLAGRAALGMMLATVERSRRRRRVPPWPAGMLVARSDLRRGSDTRVRSPGSNASSCRGRRAHRSCPRSTRREGPTPGSGEGRPRDRPSAAGNRPGRLLPPTRQATRGLLIARRRGHPQARAAADIGSRMGHVYDFRCRS
jgi:hypothetical protein